MNFVKCNAEIISTNSDHPLELIENCARTCYQSFEKKSDGSAEKMVRMLLSSHHFAMLEHLVIGMRFTTSRSVTHELVRHRVASFAERSTRYCNSKDMRICIPEWLDGIANKNDVEVNDLYKAWKSCDIMDIDAVNDNFYVDTYFSSLDNTESLYNDLLERGMKKQDARGILPNDLATDIVVTANAREWLHIIELRTAKDAHPDIQSLMNKAKKELANYCPVIFGE